MADMSVDRLMEEMQRLRRDFAQMTESLLGNVGKSTGEAASRVRHAAEDSWGEARDTVGGIARRIDEQPLLSAGVALLIGIILGALFLGRRRR